MNFLIPKKFLARAHFRARTSRIFCLVGQKTRYFELFQEKWIWARAWRGSARAPKIFLLSEKITKNPSATFFLVNISKIDDFSSI